MWFHHLLNLLHSSAGYFVSVIGSTTLGFAAALLEGVFGVIVPLVRIRRRQGKNAMREVLRENAKPALHTLATTTVLIYGTLFVYSIISTIYSDYETFASKNRELLKQNAALSQGLESRKHEINMNDPVFSNLNATIRAFQIYRHDRNGSPCVLFFTAPPSSASIANTLAQFSNSDCFTFGPFALDDPDIERLTMTGMVADRVVFHAAKGDMAANKLQNNLSSLIQMKRSYDLPNEKLCALPQNVKNERLVWFQFGSETKWNSQIHP
jgi:hypothetical protein